MTEELYDVRLVVNGVTHEVSVPARRLLSDALRHDLGLTGTHVGCEHGVCGACTILVDGDTVRAGYLSVNDVPTVVDLTGVPLADTGEAALEQLEPADDIHATAAYRAQLVRVLTERVVRAAHDDAVTRRSTTEDN